MLILNKKKCNKTNFDDITDFVWDFEGITYWNKHVNPPFVFGRSMEHKITICLIHKFDYATFG